MVDCKQIARDFALQIYADQQAGKFVAEAAKPLADYLDTLRDERLAGARVKALEWSTNWGTIKAETPIGHYFIEARRDGSFDCRLENVWKTWASSSDAAKAAAQADYERRILSALAKPAGEAEPWGWVIPKRGKRKPVIFEADKFDEVSAAAEAEIDDLGYFPVYPTPPDASAIRGALPATGPYVDRLIRVFRDRPDDDGSAVVLQDYARAAIAWSAE